jgi:L-aminopeptidase/D-esterase
MIRKTCMVAAVLVAVLGMALGAQTIEPAKPVVPVVKTGPMNAITDVPGIQVGSFQRNFTGTTVILAPQGAVGGVDVRGSAPGSRETDLLRPIDMVDKVDAVVLTGGSAYGLAAADGVMKWLEENNRGWAVGGGKVVPIVPAAVLFDPGRFGRDFTDRPNASFGYLACEAASAGPVDMGNVGAGAGAVGAALRAVSERPVRTWAMVSWSGQSWR